MDTAEVLTEARAHLNRGWIQGRLEDYRGGVCALGALNKASFVNDTARYYLKRSLPLWYRLMPGGIPAYNDAHSRTIEQMLALFDSAIQQFEEDKDRATRREGRHNKRQERQNQEYAGLQIDDLGQIIQPVLTSPKLPAVLGLVDPYAWPTISNDEGVEEDHEPVLTSSER